MSCLIQEEGFMSPKIKETKVPPLLILILGIAAVSTASIFIRFAQSGVSPTAIAAWRLTFASLMLAPFAIHQCRDEWFSLSRKEWGLAILSGVMLAVHFYTWITSLSFTSVAASVVLVNTHPIFVGLISYFFLKEQIQRYMVIGLFIAISGSMIIGLGDMQEGTHQVWGDILALTGAFSVSIYMLIGRRLRDRLTLLAYVFPVYGIAAITLMLYALTMNVNLMNYDSTMWLWLILLALIPQVIGHSSFNWALGHLPTTYVALSILGEPIGSISLAWITIGEMPSASALVGGVLILIGIFVATKEKA
jgi:drug/metabolite transporter (DMT)-like permease